MSLTINSGGSLTLTGGSGGGVSPVALYRPHTITTTADGIVFTTSTSYVDGVSPALSVIATVGSSGKLLVQLSAHLYAPSATGGTGLMGFALSGANARAASNNEAILHQSTVAGSGASQAASVLVSGLAAGATTVTLKFKSDNGYNRGFYNIGLVVTPL